MTAFATAGERSSRAPRTARTITIEKCFVGFVTRSKECDVGDGSIKSLERVATEASINLMSVLPPHYGSDAINRIDPWFKKIPMGISYNRNKTKFDYEIPWNEESDAAQYRIGNAVITVTGSRSDEGLLEITFGEVSTIGRRHLKTSLLSFSKLAEKAIVKYKKHESRRLLRRVNRDKNGGSQCRYIAIDI